MRHEKAVRLLEIAMAMQSYAGVSLKEISEEYGVDHRTAQRYRDAVLEVFKNTEEFQTETRELRWRIPSGTLNKLLGVSWDEISALDRAAKLLDRENLPEEAKRIIALKEKVLASLKSGAKARIETDASFFADHDELVVKPGPVSHVAPGVYQLLRDAVLEDGEVEILYDKPNVPQSRRVLHPYGFLTGHRHYLAAIEPDDAEPGLKMFALPRIAKAERTNRRFERNPEISIRGFTASSFGVFRDPSGPVKVVWRFSPEAAATAREFQFHPSQELETEKDGSLIVRLEACGLVEMAWHLCMWGAHVEVIEPKILRDMVDLKALRWDILP